MQLISILPKNPLHVEILIWIDSFCPENDSYLTQIDKEDYLKIKSITTTPNILPKIIFISPEEFGEVESFNWPKNTTIVCFADKNTIWNSKCYVAVRNNLHNRIIIILPENELSASDLLNQPYLGCRPWAAFPLDFIKKIIPSSFNPYKS